VGPGGQSGRTTDRRGRAGSAGGWLTGGARLTGRRSAGEGGGGGNGPGPLDLRRTARAGLGLFKIEPFDLG
jgi:hypothetical protein